MPENWIAIERGTEGLEINQNDGSLKFSALRAQGRTYDYDFQAAPNGAKLATLFHRKIRLTLAIPQGHKTTAALKLPGTAGAVPTGPVGMPGAEAIDPSALRQWVFQAGVNYKKHIRKNSWPVPESIPDSKNGDGTSTAKFQDLLGTTPKESIRDDTKYLLAMANRELLYRGRPGGVCTVMLKGLVYSYSPGMLIARIGAAPFNKCIMDVIWHTGDSTQMTELVCS